MNYFFLSILGLFLFIDATAQENLFFFPVDTSNLCRADSIVKTSSYLGNVASVTKEYIMYDKLNRIVEIRQKLSTPYYNDRKRTLEYEKNKRTHTSFFKNEEDSSWINSSKLITEFFENGITKISTSLIWDLGKEQWLNVDRTYYEYGLSNFLNQTNEDWDIITNTWVGRSRSIYDYNELNKELTRTIDDWDNISGWVSKFKSRKYFNHFDSIFLEFNEFFFNNTWIITDEYRYYYNQDNLIEAKYIYNSDGNLHSKTGYIYDGKKIKETNVTAISYFETIDSTFNKYSYSYNENGFITQFLASSKKAQNGEWVPEYKILYEYNTNNLITELLYFKWNNLIDNFIPEFKYSYYYNQKNILFRIETFQNWNIINNDFEYYNEETRYCNDKFWSLNDDVVVYPNPTTDILNINLNGIYDIEATLYDFAGRVLYNDFFYQSREVSIDINNIPSNIYLLALKNENIIKTFRIIKR